VEDYPNKDSKLIFAPASFHIAIFIPKLRKTILCHNMSVELSYVVDAELINLIVLNIILLFEIFIFRDALFVHDNPKDPR
jgi:hypothetical protein